MLAEQLGRRHQHGPGDPAPRPADPRPAVHQPRPLAAVAVRADRGRAHERLLGARRDERAVVDGGDPRGLGHHPQRARRLRRRLPGGSRAVRRAAADARRARGGAAGALAGRALGRERLPAGCARGPEVQGRSVRGVAAAEADRRRAACRSSTRSSSSAWPTRRTGTSCGAARSRTSRISVPRSRR